MKKAALYISLLLAGCADQVPVPVFTLPPVTQTGANTMGFVVDGRVWQNFGKSCTTFGCQDNVLQAFYSNKFKQFQLSAGLSSKEYNQHFGLEIVRLDSTGTYFTGTRVSQFALPPNYIALIDSKQTNYYSTAPRAAKIIITRLDTTSRIISGTFQGLLQADKDSTKTLNITDGRFDATY